MGLRVAGVDMLEGNEGPLVMEVNSSPGLEGIETATGLDVAGAIIDHVGNQVAFPELDVRQRLSVSTGYGVAEIMVREAGDFVGKTIGESGLRDRDITILTLHRDTDVIPNPKDSRRLEANDRLLCFGNLEEMRDMIPARRRRRARVRKLPEHPLPEPD
jgi:ribosomal protein S6--L-glutamate ligase